MVGNTLQQRVLLCIITAMCLPMVRCYQEDLSNTLSSLLQTKNRMNDEMAAMKGNIDQADFLKKFIDTLKDLKQNTIKFMDSRSEDPQAINQQTMDRLMKSLQNEDKYNTSDPLLASFTLSHNNEIRAWLLLTKVQESIAKSLSFSTQSICNAVKAHRHPDSRLLLDLQEISITNVCKTVLSCPFGATLYSNKRHEEGTLRRSSMYGQRGQEGSRAQIRAIRPNQYGIFPTFAPPFESREAQLARERQAKIAEELRREQERKREEERIARERELQLQLKYKEQDVREACTTEGQCNIKEAIPMMTGVLKFQINEMIYQKMCPENCQNKRCDYKRTYKRVIEDINRLIGFSASIPPYWDITWSSIYKEAVADRVFSSLDVALSVIEKKKNDFETSSIQCHSLKFAKSCPTSDILKQYTILRKLQNDRNGNARAVRDLRRYSQMNHAQMKSIQEFDLKHVASLETITTLNGNLKASVEEISARFEEAAAFEEGIAADDITSIKTDLNDHEKRLSLVQSRLISDIKEAMGLLKGVVSANMAQEATNLAVLVVQNTNPIKLITSRPDLAETMDQTWNVENAATDEDKSSSLYKGIMEQAKDSPNFIDAFGANSRQIPSLDRVINKIRDGQGGDIGDDANLFVQEYGMYTPQTDTKTLAKTEALWSNFVGTICDLLNKEAGSTGAPKTIGRSKLLCESLEGTLGQYFTLIEDIFDFQFQLVEQVAVIVHGNIAKRFSGTIKGKNVLEASQLITGFFLMQYKIQTVASVYCDALEYMQLGRRVIPCYPLDGLFKKENINALMFHSDNTLYDEVERDVYIPTRTKAKGDTGIVDLQALARGEQVIFKIPNNVSWLQTYAWLLPDETTIPFIKSLNVYLPHKEYDTGPSKRWLKTENTVTSMAGSSVSTVIPSARTAYVLPTAQNVYRTICEEGYSSCFPEIDNPYSLCNNLPKICDKSKGTKGKLGLLPTILSTFSLKVSIQEGITPAEYDAPAPETPLLLVFKVFLFLLQLCKFSRIDWMIVTIVSRI